MRNWNDLPCDVLRLVFQYLEQDKIPNFVDVNPKFILQCQLTCKKWSFLARKRIYNTIPIQFIKLESFIHTLQNSNVGPLVEYIYLSRKLRKKQTQELLVYLRHIATYCTFLKSFRVRTGDFRPIWELIKDKRSKGNLTRLQSVPACNNSPNRIIQNYSEVVFGLQQSLHELVVYNSKLLLDESKAWHFPGVKTVFFKFGYYFDASIINTHLKQIPSATEIRIDIENHSLEKRPAVESDLHTFPEVKRVHVRQPGRCCNEVYSQVIKVFPNLQKVDVILDKSDKAQAPMSTEEAVQFFEYLLHVPEFSTAQIRTANINDILKDIQGKDRCITRLKLSYNGVISDEPQTLYIKTSPCVKDKIIIDISCKPQVPPMSPHIGLIEHSGENLEYLEIDMYNPDVGKKTKIRRFGDSVTFSSFLLQCPRLLGIRVSNTALNIFGENTQFQKNVKIRDYICLNNVIIDPSFLRSMSLSVSYISRFTLADCKFVDEPQDTSIREIGMPNTVFRNIMYKDNRKALCETCLKLTKTINNEVSWHITAESVTRPSTKKEYVKALRNTSVISLFIKCKDISSVTIRIPKVNTVLNF